MLNPSIFRAYDIRGIYPGEINEETAYKIGRAFVVYLKKNGMGESEKIVVGHDVRISSPVLNKSFIEGILDEGINVWDIGLASIDMVYFASGCFHLPAAMITASHNSKEFNGFKLMKRDVEFFDVKDLEIIIDEKGADLSKEKGKITEGEIKSDYLKCILEFINFETIKPIRIAIDTISGAVGPILKLILEKLPVECFLMDSTPNGEFPNHDPDPTKEKNIADLENEINSGHYDFGCAFDADGDRIIFVDEKGKAIDTSIIGAIMARYFLKKYPRDKIIYNVVTGRIVSDIINIYNGEAIRERVGHTFIGRRLKEVDGILGIETSGHYFFKKFFYADSGIISFLVMLDILSNEKKSLSILVSELDRYFSIPEMNFKVSEPEEIIKKIAQNFEGYDIDWLDGLSVKTPDFWLNLRPSNTESLIRLNIEAKSESVLNRVKNDLLGLLKK